MENPTTTTVTMPAHMLPKQPTETTIESVLQAPRPAAKHHIFQVSKPMKQPSIQPSRQTTKTMVEREPQYHSFVYDSGNETTKIQIKLPTEQRYDCIATTHNALIQNCWKIIDK